MSTRVKINPLPEPATWSLAEASAVLGVHRHTLRALTEKGVVPSIKIGARVLIPRAGLLKLINGKQQVTA